jgi:hypothetical protein
VLVRGNSKFVEEAVMPDLLHVVPIVDNTVLDGIGNLEDTLLSLSFLSDVAVLIHTNHDVFVFGSTDH